jgi:hypothetical protein
MFDMTVFTSASHIDNPVLGDEVADALDGLMRTSSALRKASTNEGLHRG